MIRPNLDEVLEPEKSEPVRSATVEGAEKLAQASQTKSSSPSPIHKATVGYVLAEDDAIGELRAQWPSCSEAELHEMHEENLLAAAALSL